MRGLGFSQLHLTKSQIYFGGVDEDVKQNILSMWGYGEGLLLLKYLGVPLSTKKLTISQCKPLVEKMTACISVWMTKFMSYASRLQLIKAVLHGVQSF